jgi:benzoylformate decarboxylase
MDAMVSRRGKAPWPGFPEVSLARLADGFGCPSERVSAPGRLAVLLDQVMPTLASRNQPLLIDVEVTDEPPGR